MLKATDKEKLKKLGLDADALETAAKADVEIDVAIPDGTFFTPEALTQRDANTRRLGHDEGKIAGEEVAVKEIKTAKNLKFDGKKVADLTAHLESLKAPEETEALAKLQTNLKTEEKARKKAEALLAEKESTFTVLSKIPATNNGMKQAEVLSVMQANGYEFKKDETGKMVPYLNGQVQRDPHDQSVLEVDTSISGFLTERKWLGEAQEQRGGFGGGNSEVKTPGGIPTTKAQIEENYRKLGKNPMGADYIPYYTAEAAKAKAAGIDIK